MKYIPHSEADIALMLKTIGVDSVDALFEQIPQNARFSGRLNLPPPLSEFELTEQLNRLSQTAATAKLSFLGAGIYDHYIPAAVDHLLQRSEFYTAYTPYQPEISQGTLQAIFEYQSVICRIFDMATSNASLYDGATAMVEAALMAQRVEQRPRIVVSDGVHPQYVETLQTYLRPRNPEGTWITRVPLDPVTGQTDCDALQSAVKDAAAVIVGYPNFFGVIEPLDRIVTIAHAAGARMITSTGDPFAFGVIAPPGDLQVDIATAEGQSLCQPPSFGGPGLGIFAIADDRKLLRQMPGRLVGETVDTEGRRGYVLTLSTREQHIRREKATSNICTNHGLCALAAVIHASLLGKTGFAQIAHNCLSLTEYLKSGIRHLSGFSLYHSGPTFNEFAFRCDTADADTLLAHMETHHILGGVNLRQFGGAPNILLTAVTEKMNRRKLDAFLEALSTLPCR